MPAVGDGRRCGGGMVDVLKTGLLEMRWNGGLALLWVNLLGSWGCLILFVIILTLAGEIIRALVFMRRTELESRGLAAIRH